MTLEASLGQSVGARLDGFRPLVGVVHTPAKTSMNTLWRAILARATIQRLEDSRL